jgi:methionyl-tRNA formyltransferase
MKLVYLGSPEAAVAPLRALVANGHEIVLVVSQPDRKRGRGGALVPSPVKAAALELGLTVTDRVADVGGAVAALGVVVAYGRLIKPDLLAKIPFVNLHFSLLPRWRGAAPVERALLAGDRETGVCLMALEEGLDTGPVYQRVVIAIHDDESVTSLRNRLVAIGTDMLISALGTSTGLGVAEPQQGTPTYAAKLNPAEFEIDWARSSEEISRLIRLQTAWTMFRGKRLKVLEVKRAYESQISTNDAAYLSGAFVGGSDEPTGHRGLMVRTGDGMLLLERVQPEGKPTMDAVAWSNGARPLPGEVLGHA